MLVGHTISDELGVILALDQGVCEFLCRPEAEIVGVSYLDLTCPEDRSWNKIIVDAIDHNGKPVTFQKRYLLPTGVTISCEVQASRLGEGRNRERLIGTLHQLNPKPVSITPLSLWQSARRMSETLERRRAELGDDLFSDYPWTVLLHLYLAEAEGQCVDETALAARAGTPGRMLVRWLRALEQRGLVEFLARPMCIAQLTNEGISKVEKLLGEAAV
jgi:PAS domain-containing protein